ncbi:hypothetical protein HDF08_001741 [Edaphobacter lichenicola]|uniref:Uncharacterized protein n=1 Tax=Tunturiibacter lichenicola TaxID=2051959 RepID=A0A852VGV9_9BACT|nr:hypothetical protein [Edaphobacter lichenicola]
MRRKYRVWSLSEKREPVDQMVTFRHEALNPVKPLSFLSHCYTASYTWRIDPIQSSILKE